MDGRELRFRGPWTPSPTSQQWCTQAASGLVEGDVAPPQLERPPKAELGDYSTNAAMMLTRSLSRPPREIAEQLGAALADRLGDHLERVEVAGPGFLNLFMSDAWYAGVVAAVAGAEDYGRGGQGARVNVEFVSANPTGPITVASARHAAYGDSLARVLELAGNDVDREYYVNDFGTQIQRFGQSLSARARGQEPPEDGYQGEYVTELAARVDGAADMAPEELGRRGVELMLEGIEATLGRFGVHMDRYARESATHEADAVQAAIGAAARGRAHLRAGRRHVAAHHRASGTTRTGCWCAPPARSPTSRPTSRTTGPSTSGATTCRSWSWAPTTTATSRA